MTNTRRRGNTAWIKTALFIACAAPAAILLVQALTGNLGAEPVDRLTGETGKWALRLLLVTLAVTPARRLTGINSLIRYRRMLGLFGFFYALVHFCIFIVLEHFFDPGAIIEDIAEHPYILVGFVAFTVLVPLAATSTNAMVRRLGARRWTRLHRLVYLAAVAAVVHFLWLVKNDITEPLIYGAILAVLFTLRLPVPGTSRSRQNAGTG